MGKTLGIIAATIVGLIVLFLIGISFVSGEYHVEREVTINKSKSEVFDYIKHLKNQNNYSTWATADPNMKKEYKGTDGTIGFVSAWDSEVEEVGKGEQEIIGIDEGNRIDFEIRFVKPFEQTDNAYMLTSEVEGGTLVEWGFDGEMPYPANAMLLFMDFDELLGPDLQKGLEKLKIVLEE